MKKAIRLSALLLLVSTGLFAATPAKTETVKDEISVESTTKVLAVGVNILKESKSRTYVTFYDKTNNEVMRDYLPTKGMIQKVYNLSRLDYGTYTMKVTSNDQVVEKQIHIFNEFGKRAYVILQ